MHSPEVIVQLPLAVSLKGASLAEERKILVDISDVSSQVFRTNGRVAALVARVSNPLVYCSHVKLKIIFSIRLKITLVALDFESHVLDLDMLCKEELFSRSVLAVLALILFAFMLGCYVNFQVAHGSVLLFTEMTRVLNAFVLGPDVEDERPGG